MKKILFINSMYIGEKSGTGVTLSNIWSEYPSESIMQLIIGSDDGNGICSDVKTVYTPYSFCRIPNLVHSRSRKGGSGDGAEQGSRLNSNIAQRGLRNAIHDFIRGTLDAWPNNYKSVEKYIEEFKPDVIYTLGASIRILNTAKHFAKKHKIPIIIHLMDDWPETIYTASRTSRIFHSIILRKLKKCHKYSKYNFAISAPLALKYEKIYGVKYEMLMNPAMNIVDECSSNTANDKDRPLRFLYAGSLALNRNKSIKQITSILSSFAKKGYKSEVHLYIPKVDDTAFNRELFADDCVIINEYVPKEELVKIYSESDVFIFTESFEANIVEFIKLSLSTKVPEYLAAGKPMLAYLHKDLYSRSYLAENNCAFVATDETELYSALEDILTSSEKREVIAKNALAEANKTHSMEAVKVKLEASICKSTQ